MLDDIKDLPITPVKSFSTYVVNFHFVFYGTDRYYVMVNCVMKDQYKTKYVTDIQNLPNYIGNLVTYVRKYAGNLAASGAFDGIREHDTSIREIDLFLAVQDVDNQFQNALEVRNLVMAFYHLVEAKLQLMACNYQLFQNYVSGSYITYVQQVSR